MSEIFNKQVKHYTEKFEKTLDGLRKKDITSLANKNGVSDLENAFVSNSEDFRKMVLKVASTLMPGHVSCTTYAAVCARIAEEFNMNYKAYAGFCLKENHSTKAKDIAYYNERKANGIEHPMMATHVYLDCNNISYEFYSGDTSNIEHIDCVVIAER